MEAKTFSAEQYRAEWNRAKPHLRGARMANEVLRHPEVDYSFPYGNRHGDDWEIVAAIGQACWDKTESLLDSIRATLNQGERK